MSTNSSEQSNFISLFNFGSFWVARLTDFFQGSLDLQLRTGGRVMSFEGFGVDICRGKFMWREHCSKVQGQEVDHAL